MGDVNDLVLDKKFAFGILEEYDEVSKLDDYPPLSYTVCTVYCW